LRLKRSAPWLTRAQNEIESSPARLHQSGLPHIRHGRARLTRLYLESPILGLEEKSQSTFTARRFIVLKAADFIFKNR
jgi:hypothetical protein